MTGRRGKRRHTKRTIIARVFTRWTSPIELHAADAADVVFGHVPAPGGDGVPGVDCYFDFGVWEGERANKGEIGGELWGEGGFGYLLVWTL